MSRRETPIELARVIDPRSVAIVGATEDYTKFGGRFMHHLVELGYEGHIVPINPKRDTILGIPCHPSIGDVPEAPDLALIALPATLLLDAIEACGEAGVGACVVATAQMAEFDAKGAELERRIVETAKRYNMRLIGPNCMGMIIPAAKMALSSTPTLRYAGALKPGSVAFISQSGALMGSLFVQAHDHGVGLSGMVSIGNQADMELCDFLEAFLDRDDTDTICLYVEGVKSPDRLRELALRARQAGKRILAVKAGRTEAGSVLARSHTSSLAGSYSAFEALCRDTGILLLDDPDSMILCAGVLARNPRMGAGDVAVVCSSGGGGAILADRMALSGMAMVDYAPATREKLERDYQPSHQNNPLDLGAHKGSLEIGIFSRTMEAIYEDPGVGVFVYVFTPQPMMPETLEIIISLWQRQEKPFVLVLNISHFGETLRQRAIEAGVPFVMRSDDLMRTLTLMQTERDSDKALRPTLPERPSGLAAATPPADGFLTEPEAKALMASYGVVIPGSRLTSTVDEAIAAAHKFGYPVVMKGVLPGVVHKSDMGLVEVGIDSDEALREAFERIAAVARRERPEDPVSIDVQQLVGPGVELIAGVTNAGDFGPQIMVGAGGIHVELLKDVRQMRAPASPDQVREMLRSLRIWPLLDGARNGARMDVDAACEAISRLSWLGVDLGNRLVDFEVNPLRVTPDGAYALDGRGTISPS